MGTPSDLVSRRKAASMLQITTRTLTAWVRQGLLKQVFRERKAYFFRTDVVAICQIFNGKTDYASIANLALRAYIRAEHAERKTREISELLGLETQPIETDEQTVLTFYAEAKRRLVESPPIHAVEVMLLAKQLHGITEEYLQLVERYTLDPEPWQRYLKLADYLMKNAPRKYFSQDQELAAAYGYVEAARRHLRPVAYFHARVKYGKEEANRAFIGAHVTDDVINVMFPH